MAMVPSAVGGGSIRTNLKDVVADDIRNLIFSGQLKPGQKVDQDEIAEADGAARAVQDDASPLFEIAGGWAEVAGDQHRQIEAALRIRDGAAAEQAMHDHILSGGEYAVKMLRESGFWDTEAE